MNSFNLSDKESTSYEAVVKGFESHFIPKRNVIYERAKFNLRSQLADEFVDTFVMALHSLAEKYEYKSMQNELIRDRLLMGLLDKRLSEMLQVDATLILETAVNKARQTDRICAVGHLLKSTLKDVQPSEEAVEFAKRQVILGNQSGNEWFLASVNGKEISSPWRTEVNVGGQVIQFKIDMGADDTVVPEQVFGSRYSASNLEIKPVNTQLFGPCATSLMAATYTIRLKDVVPVSLHAPRRVALPLQPKLKQETDRLVNMGIISPVDRLTEWCCGIVIVPKQNGQIRL
ncbi:hypothetical protein PR048_021830 [Dryococelus australis]|uniref:Peptidase A2 domain-containing protein n=1 Tax=Dryococelus australis TaxID=614101 RepID=A0ABQ9GZC7_9NEOP|nr:hypothetical protein PR048_021830 [Dryococelus australis]